MTALDDILTVYKYTRRRYRGGHTGRPWPHLGNLHRARLLAMNIYIRTTEKPRTGLNEPLTRQPPPGSPHTEKGRRRWGQTSWVTNHNPSETTP